MGVPRNLEIKKNGDERVRVDSEDHFEWTAQVRHVNKQPRRFTTRWKIFTSMGLK
jgi:hypothetical protein